jgi:hypothetical protein
MSLKVNFHPTLKITWPNKCVHCGGSPDETDTVYKSRYRGTGYYILFFTYNQQRFSVSYPICHKHKLLAKLCRFLYWFLLIPVFILGFGVIMNFGSDYNNNKIVIYFIFALAIFILSIKLQPLRITSAGEHGITLNFKNENIANDFAVNNHLKI